MLRHFYNAVLAVIVQVLEQRFLLKLNALDDLLSKWQDILNQSS